MTNIFVISDTHFSHANILTFKGLDGSLIRPGFRSVEEMNEIIVDNWNKTVKPDDIVYHLGDVGFGNMTPILSRLAGRKRLILGNHDDHDPTVYRPFFQKILSWRKITDLYKIPVVLCHYPLHISSFRYTPDCKAINIHGHIHEKTVGDPSYVNVSVERTGYRPIPIEEIIDGVFRDI